MGFFADVAAITDLLAAKEEAVQEAERLKGWAKRLHDIHLDIASRVDENPAALADAAEEARAHLRDYQSSTGAAASVVGTEERPKPARAPRSDKGKPRGPKGTAREGRSSPLTPNIRSMLFAAVESEPQTLPAIIAATGLDNAEALLCEDPDTFISWRTLRAGDTSDVTVWGLSDQLMKAAQNSGIKWSAVTDGKQRNLDLVASHLGCSHANAAKLIDNAKAGDWE